MSEVGTGLDGLDVSLLQLGLVPRISRSWTPGGLFSGSAEIAETRSLAVCAASPSLEHRAAVLVPVSKSDFTAVDTCSLGSPVRVPSFADLPMTIAIAP